MEAPFMGMLGLTVFEIQPVMLGMMLLGSVLVGIAWPLRLVASVRIGWILLLGSWFIGALLMVGPGGFVLRYLPVMGLMLALPCFAVGWWQLCGKGGVKRQVLRGARWWWTPPR